MLTDEQLADRLRAALARATAHVAPPAGLLEAVHAELAEGAQPGAPGEQRRWRPVLAGAAGLILAVAVAVVVIVLAGHRSATAPPTVPSRVGRATAPSPRVPAPAVVSPSAVAAPVQLHIGAIALYCSGATGNFVVCRAGQRPVTPRAQRLVEVRVVARLASGRNSWYAWNLTAPAGCPQASNGGPTRSPARPGSTLVFDTLVPPSCRGTMRALVVYVTQAANADRERTVVVGRTRAALP